MSKKEKSQQVRIQLDLDFSKKLTKEQIDVVLTNIAEAIKSHANSAGIAPEDSEAFTREFTLTCEQTENQLTEIL